jgi:tRNA (mo5U34)-methyltransferase
VKQPSIYPETFADLTDDQIRKLVADSDWYHAIDLGDGDWTNGQFDMRRFVQNYRFPENLAGMRVLDVGRSSGWFAFEFERRGAAEVVATELPLDSTKDYVGPLTAQLILDWVNSKRAPANPATSLASLRMDFFVAHRLRRSSVVPVFAKMDEGLKAYGKFDLVFVGSVLNHVRDPAAALYALFDVVKEGGRLIVANPVHENGSGDPSFRLIGMAGTGLTTWYLPNKPALLALIAAAGFADAAVVAEFELRTTRGDTRIPHAVAHATRPTDKVVRRTFAALLDRQHSGINEVA